MDDVEHISRKGSAVPLSWFPVPEETELPEDLQGPSEGAGEDRVRPKRLPGLTASAPSACAPGSPTHRQLHEPTPNLDAAEREMIAVAVSMANGCLYRLAHGAALREALGDPILADRVTLDHRRAGLDERRTAILDFAVKVTERPSSARRKTSNTSRDSA